MIKGGYYIKARKIQDSEISNAPPHVREIWDLLIKDANHKDVGNIKRGSTMRSLNDIREALCWFVGYRKEMYSKSKCEMAMNWLRKHGMITTTKTTRGMIITVCNYDEYQNPQNYETNNEKSTKPTRKKQPSDTINKNVKNYNNVKNDKKVNIPEEWDSIFFDWFKYKDERKEYYVESGMIKLINEHLTKGYPNRFRDAVNYSMANNWKGIFKKKEDFKNQPKNLYSGYKDSSYN